MTNSHPGITASQLRAILPPRVIWQCLDIFLVVTTRGGVLITDRNTVSSKIEIENTAKHPIMHRLASYKQRIIYLKCQNAEVEKLCHRAEFLSFFFTLFLLLQSIPLIFSCIKLRICLISQYHIILFIVLKQKLVI